MHVLINCLSAASGGAITYLRHVIPRLAELFERAPGHGVTVLATDAQASVIGVGEGGPLNLIVHTPGSVWARKAWEYRELPRLVSDLGVDVVFTPYQIERGLPGVHQVLMIRNMEPFLFHRYRYDLTTRLRNALLRRASNRSLRRADRVIAVSEFAASYLTDDLGVPSADVRVVYHGRPDMPTEAGLDALDIEGVREGDRVVFTAGSFLPYRRYEDLIAAFERLRPGTERCKLVIAGSGSDRTYARLIADRIARSPARDAIVALGQVPWDDMRTLYAASTVCATSTEIEACPNIALEAMAAGCVVVASDRPPLPEIFADAALLYRARDVDDLAGALQRALDDTELRDDLGRRAIARANDFSWDVCASRTFSALVDW